MLRFLRPQFTAPGAMAIQVLSALFFVVSGILWAPVALGEPTLEELLNATDDVARDDSSHGTITMNVKTKRYERSLTMTMWTLGEERSLMRIDAPAKEKGTATLKVDDNIWNYLPKIDRTIKVPASMMSGSWMGNHFTNDDLVKENRMADQFEGVITQRPDTGGLYVIELTPKPDAPVVWGKVIVEITPDLLPTQIRYFDEKGALKRTMTFSDVKTFGERKMPARMKMVPADKPNEFTEIVYESIEFVDVPESLFSLQALRR